MSCQYLVKVKKTEESPEGNSGKDLLLTSISSTLVLANLPFLQGTDQDDSLGLASDQLDLYITRGCSVAAFANLFARLLLGCLDSMC